MIVKTMYAGQTLTERECVLSMVIIIFSYLTSL